MDFHYEVNGEMYDFSIPGGGFTTLENVVEVLGIDTSYRMSTGEVVKLGTKEFVEKVESVSFSNPALVDVSRVDNDTTVGEIKNSRELECEYSAELSEDQIAEINDSVVEAGDWAIISLKAFSSDEELTVRMVNGDEWAIQVTDEGADNNTTVTFYTVGNGVLKSAGSGVTIPNNTSLTVSNRTVSNNYVMKSPIVTYSSEGIVNSNGKTVQNGYPDGSIDLLVTQNTLGQSSENNIFVGYIVNNRTANCASDKWNGWIEANVLQTGGLKKFGFAENTSFVAIFKPSNSYFVYYTTDGNGSISGGNTTDFLKWSYASDSTGATAVPNVGYEFDHWEYNGGEYTGETFDLSKVSADGVVKAVFKELPKVTITYAVNAGRVKITGKDYSNQTGNGKQGLSPSDSETIPVGSIPSGAFANNTTTDGSTFLYWQRKSDSAIVSNDATLVISEVADADETYTAVYATPKSRRIYFEVDDSTHGHIVRGGSNYEGTAIGVSKDNNTLKLGNTYEATPNSGFQFDHWELNGETLSVGASTDTLGVEDDTSIILYRLKAFFRPEGTIKISYEAENGGSVSVSGPEYMGGESVIQGSTASHTDSNYVFKGWYKGDELFSTNATLTAEDLSTITEDTKFTAKFYPPVTIKYVSSSSDGSVDVAEEIVKFGGTPIGSTATAVANRFFAGWIDENGELVSTEYKLIPNYIYPDENDKTITYTATFTANGYVYYTANDTDLVKNIARTSGGSFTNQVLNQSATASLSVSSFSVEDDPSSTITFNTNPQFVRWELIDSNGEIHIVNNSYTVNAKSQNIDNLRIVKAIVKPKDTYIVNYTVQTGNTSGDTTGGNISNTTDYAGYASATGNTATANLAGGYRFIGWYVGERFLSDHETITADDLITWKNAGYISADDTVITARFGIGHTITYKRTYGETTEDLGTEITAGADDRKGYTAENDVPGYNFSAWYLVNADGTETPISENAALTNNDLKDLTINSDVTILAKYEKAASATYKVNYIDAGKKGVSNFGKVVVNLQTVEYDGSFTDTVGSDGKLRYTAVARPARGCEFVNWTVTDKNGNPTTVAGLNVNDPTIENLALSDDVILTANFQKKSGAIEIIYNIQYDTQAYYWATIKVGDKSASGTQTENVYLSEVVPAGEAALGCTATPTHTGRIIGWTYGADNTAEDSRIHGNDKDNVFLMSSQFVPDGEYLKDVDGSGYRYYSVVVKPEANVYIQTKVNIAEAGDWWHGDRPDDGNKNSNSYYTDKILFVFNRGRDYGGTNPVDAEANFSKNFTPYKVDINPGYKLIGFTYNGKDVEVDYTTGGDNNDYVATDTRKLRKLNASEILLKNSVEIDNAYYIR